MTDLRGQSQARGINNNNPFNIRRSSNAWFGKVSWSDSTDPDFEQFDSIEHGIRAGVKNAHSIIASGSNTCNTFFNTYAPASDDNDPGNYANVVASKCGLSPDNVIDFSNGNLVKAFCRAIMEQENGDSAAQVITDTMIQTGMDLSQLFFS